MRPLIGIRGLCPLLQVFDMPLSVRFYCELLGFEISSRSPTYAVENGVELFHWVLLRRGDTELMLNTAYDEGQRPASPAWNGLRATGTQPCSSDAPMWMLPMSRLKATECHALPQKRHGTGCGSCHFVIQMVTELRFNGAWPETYQQVCQRTEAVQTLRRAARPQRRSPPRPHRIPCRAAQRQAGSVASSDRCDSRSSSAAQPSPAVRYLLRRAAPRRTNRIFTPGPRKPDDDALSHLEAVSKFHIWPYGDVNASCS
jgi:hypothetical protein